MHGSWRIGRLFGIEVRIHWTFLLLVGWVLYSRLGDGATLPAALLTLGFVFAVFGCVVLHECGHALAARRYGIGTKDITLLPIGGLARLDRLQEEPGREFVVAIAGPLVNVGIAAVIALGLWIGPGFGGLNAMAEGSAADPLAGHFIESLLAVNLFLVAFNLLPAFPMDGGRVLRAILAMRLDHVRATRIAASVGRFMAIGFAILGLLAGNPFLLFIALFVFLGATAESRHEELRWAMRGLPVRAAMLTRFRRLRADETIGDAADELIAASQTEFPVLDHDRLVGVLTRDAIVQAIRSGRETSPVREVMQPMTTGPDPDGPLSAVFDRMQTGGERAVPVLSGDEVVGLVTIENLGEWVMLSSARR
jgi:Zn-dependent protease/CBS domain-containing protein